MITKEEYLANPCKAASIPYWKAKSITVPYGMVILHRDEFNRFECQQYFDELYFRLIHMMQGLSAPTLPPGYSICSATLSDFTAHINGCYDEIHIDEEELHSFLTHPVYDADLWISVKDNRTGEIIATGIGEIDQEIGEGVLEWIQVSKPYRRKGLGKYMVSELLWRMKGKANFATVSGQCNNTTNPESLYRSCGFAGSDIWHVLKKIKL